MMLRMLVLVWMMALPAGAQTALTDAAIDRIRAAPEQFLEEMAGLILGYGQARGIDAPGIDRFLDVQRAKLRAREMRRFWLTDLDDDGQVTAAEVGVLITAEGASARGRLWRSHMRADANGDGTVTLAEARTLAASVADGAMTGGRMDALRGLMDFDRDHDGFVTLKELAQAVDLLRVET